MSFSKNAFSNNLRIVVTVLNDKSETLLVRNPCMLETGTNELVTDPSVSAAESEISS